MRLKRKKGYGPAGDVSEGVEGKVLDVDLLRVVLVVGGEKSLVGELDGRGHQVIVDLLGRCRFGKSHSRMQQCQQCNHHEGTSPAPLLRHHLGLWKKRKK